MADPRMLWRRWWLRSYGRRAVAAAAAGVLAAVAIQWLLWQWNLRFLFGGWIGATVTLALWLMWERRRIVRNDFVVRNRDTEALWLLAHADSQGLTGSAARAWLHNQVEGEIRRAQPRTLPYASVLGLALAGTLLMQIRMLPAFLGWTVLGPWGPHVTVHGQVLRDITVEYQPAQYARQEAYPLVSGVGSVRLERGGQLRIRGRALYALGQPMARLHTVQGILRAEQSGIEDEGWVHFALPVTSSGAVHVQLAVESLGLTMMQSEVLRLDVVDDPKPAVQWSQLPEDTLYDEDEAWQASLTATDNHGVRWVGFRISDDGGHSVTDIAEAGPQSQGLYAERTTSAPARVVPGLYLGRLKSGIWTLTPLAEDWNHAVTEPGYGQSVTIVVQSRFDKHKDLADRMHELFLLALGYTADRWETMPVDRGAVKRVTELWSSLQQRSADAWSAFGLDVVERAVRKLVEAIENPRQPVLRFEAAALELMRAEELEQQSVVSDRMGDVERSQQDLMAALNDAAASDEEVMRLVRELLQKMQKLSEAARDRNRPLPQELYNKEAFQQENLNDQKSDLQTMLEKLQSGDRAGAVDMLKSLMSDMDKMRSELQQAGAASTPSDQSMPEESGAANSASSGDNATAEQLTQVRKAKAEIQKAMDEQLKALAKADGAKKQLEDRPGMAPGQAEGKLGEPSSQAGRAASQLQAAQKAVEPDPAKSGSIMDREAEQVRQAGQSWQKARQRLDRPGASGQGVPDPSHRLGEFQKEGEQSVQQLRQAMQSLNQKEQALQRMQMSGSRSQGETQRDTDFDEERQKAESNARLRAKLFDNFGAGMPESEKNANQQYFDKLVR